MAEDTVRKPDLKLVAPNDAADVESLWLDTSLGDGITDLHWHEIHIGKPKDYFRVHPDESYRRRTEIYVHKPEDAVEEQFYILAPNMRGRLPEARPCVVVTCIYRNGTPRLWPIMFPRSGEKDNTAWTSARAAARVAIDKWVKLVWASRAYQTRDAQAGYAPDPDWKKVPSFNDMVRLAFGLHGVIHDETHPMWRELMGAPAKAPDNDGDL
jgi:hypothetical protein